VGVSLATHQAVLLCFDFHFPPIVLLVVTMFLFHNLIYVSQSLVELLVAFTAMGCSASNSLKLLSPYVCSIGQYTIVVFS
jgi:hypothetical protein